MDGWGAGGEGGGSLVITGPEALVAPWSSAAETVIVSVCAACANERLWARDLSDISVSAWPSRA